MFIPTCCLYVKPMMIMMSIFRQCPTSAPRVPHEWPQGEPPGAADRLQRRGASHLQGAGACAQMKISSGLFLMKYVGCNNRHTLGG